MYRTQVLLPSGQFELVGSRPGSADLSPESHAEFHYEIGEGLGFDRGPCLVFDIKLGEF